MQLKVLMFGWEFPPFKSGGLGTACFGLTKALSDLGTKVLFVIPRAPGEIPFSHVNLISAYSFMNKHIAEIKVDSLLSPYLDFHTYKKQLGSAGKKGGESNIYGHNLMEEVARYSALARVIGKKYRFDVIHAHDWMSAQAGIAAKEVSGKPLIFQIHATEFDRTGGSPNPEIYKIEKQAFEKADRIIAVSKFTKNMVVKHYGIDACKIDVVYNSISKEEEPHNGDAASNQPTLSPTDKIVLYLGRITIQKGPGYFLEAAKKVLEFDPNVKFVVAGSGDMMPLMVEKAAQLGISKQVIFSGFLRGKEVDTAFKMADVYVMPSVSEPFGITPLEAMKNGTPCIISKQSGVSEIVKHCLKADFWDVDQMVNQIMGVLNYRALQHTMSSSGFDEIMEMTWEDSALECLEVYRRVL